MSEISTVVSLIIGLTSLIGGIILWYKGSVEKRYAAERDFNHIRKNQEQFASNIGTVFDELEEILQIAKTSHEETREMRRDVSDLGRTLIELKAHILAIQNRQEGIAARIDGNTGGWKRNE